jgi:glycosyltransferase involved in cell wall biosynthesis
MYGNWVDVYNSAPDTGIYQAMNRAVHHCTGDYTIFINAADQLMSNATLADLAAQMNDRDDVVTGQAVEIETGKVHPFRPPNMFWAGMTFDHQASVVRTSLLKELKYDESLKISGDFDFLSRLRISGARFRAIPLQICRKPYEVGASSTFISRFRERFGLSVRYFGARYPVELTLIGELMDHMVKEFGIKHRLDEMEAMSVEELISLYDELAALADRRDNKSKS